MKNSVIQMNAQEGNLKYDYFKLEEFLTLVGTKNLSRCYNSLVYSFTDLLAFAFNHQEELLRGSQIQDEATDHIKYIGELFQILEDLPENKD